MPYLGSTPNASFSSRTKQDFTANGSTKAFTLSSAVASANDIEVFVGNVRQEPTDAYTVNGVTLTMSAAPANGVNFYVIFKGVEENSVVPADGTISSAKLTSNALSPITLSSGKVGIGETSPLGKLHVKTADSGATADAGADDLIVENSAAAGISILSGASQAGSIYFGDAGTNWDGYIAYSQSSRSMTLGTAAGGGSVSIDSVGRVRMPGQPCFSATATTTNIPLSTSTTVTLSAERFDVGGNLTNNIFTAPITGKYLFTYIYYVTNLDASHTTFDAHILTSNKQYQQTMRPSVFMNSDGNFGVSGSVIADMDVNDTCRYTVYVSGGGAQTDIHGDSHVSGCLLF